ISRIQRRVAPDRPHGEYRALRPFRGDAVLARIGPPEAFPDGLAGRCAYDRRRLPLRRPSIGLAHRLRSADLGLAIGQVAAGVQIAPCARASAILLSSNPTTSLRISSVCSPSSGEDFTSTCEPDSLIGQPTVRNLPRFG